MRRPAAFAAAAFFTVWLAACGRAPSAAVACGPDNCAGCCDVSGACHTGLETQACGTQGAACAACGEGLICSFGTCEEPEDAGSGCGPSSCAGCCEAGQCVDPPSSAACGAAGAACVSCQGAAVCLDGACQSPRDGGQQDGGATDAGARDGGGMTPSDGGFVFLALHPQAAAQNTTWGKELGILYAFNGRLYAGYGDWTANTGPIHIRPFDPALDAFSPDAHVSDTEAIESFRTINGKLWAPAVDPRIRADYAVGEPWADSRALAMTHVFDVATLNGTDVLAASQAGNANCRIHRTAGPRPDGGYSWTVIHEEPPLRTGSFCRPYLAGTYQGRFYYQATDYPSGKHARSRVFDGGSWTDGPDLLPTYGEGHRLTEFAGHMVYRGTRSSYVSSLFASDGVYVSEPLYGTRVSGYSVSGPRLLVLRVVTGGRREILRTDNLKAWQLLAAAPPPNAISIAELDGGIYVGTTDAGLWRHEGEPSWSDVPGSWNDYPLVTLVSPAGDGGTYAGDAGALLSATAADRDGTIARVDFWVGSTRIPLTAPPYETVWFPPGPGTYSIYARSIDDRNAYATSPAYVLVVP